MRSKIIILFILISTALLGLEISGTVLNEKGKPIDNVIVSTDSKAVITGKNGRFILKDISADNKVTLHKIGYADIILSAEKIPSKLILQTAPVQIPGVQVMGIKSNEALLKTLDKIVIQVDSINNFKNAADILRNRADLLISGTNLHGETQNVSVPGYKARHTLIMLDGIPLNKSGTAFDIASIPAEIIDNIEIIKGSASSQGGAGSMGGIININTKRSGGKLSASLNHGFGSFGLDTTSLIFSGSNPRFQTFIFLSKSYSRNDFKYVPLENPDTLWIREYNDKKIYDADLNIGHTSDFGTINYKLLYQDFFKKLPGNIESLFWFENSRITGKTQRHFLNYSKRFSEFFLKTDLFYSNEKTTYDNTRINSMYHNNLLLYVLGENHQQDRGVKCKLEYKDDTFYFDWGGEYRYEKFEYSEITNPVNSISEVYRENYAVFGNTILIQHIFPFRLSLSASTRWDHTTDFKDFTSWRIAPEFGYENFFRITLGGSVSNGYTLPSFYSLYWIGDSQVMGNPDLKPEGSLSWQIFTQFELENNFLKLTYRHDDIDDMIIWYPNLFQKWKPMNLSCTETFTYEVEFRLKPYEFAELNCIYDHVKAINRAKETSYYGKKIIYIPDHSFNANLKLKYKKISGDINYSYTGKRWDTLDQQTSENSLPAYDLLNAGLQYSIFWKNLELASGIVLHNISDNLYELYEHVPQPGFNWEMNLSLKYEI
ncbi:MAG: TonB-dependent receptor [Candidatus Cloacimonetes bacterium]|nr:TonB-dependent receptor [Candidatus Cloacimonadota bacterium]MBL7149320.1 TonB-dependent receptor [Candidatus Cloacimonadota bacterium]